MQVSLQEIMVQYATQKGGGLPLSPQEICNAVVQWVQEYTKITLDNADGKLYRHIVEFQITFEKATRTFTVEFYSTSSERKYANGEATKLLYNEHITQATLKQSDYTLTGGVVRITSSDETMSSYYGLIMGQNMGQSSGSAVSIYASGAIASWNSPVINKYNIYEV